MSVPTPKMTFALFCAVKTDVRNLGLSFDECSMLIGMTRTGRTEEVKKYLASKGAKFKEEELVDKDTLNESIYNKAHEAGMKAVSGLNVIPMVVTQHANPIDDNSPVVNSYFVEDGCCGFAWVNIKPANSSFAKWLVKNNHARKNSYEPGISIWIHDFNQSYQKKMTYAYAFAKVLQEHEIRAYAGSRLD